jgi:hypothetical protein
MMKVFSFGVQPYQVQLYLRHRQYKMLSLLPVAKMFWTYLPLFGLFKQPAVEFYLLPLALVFNLPYIGVYHDYY